MQKLDQDSFTRREYKLLTPKQRDRMITARRIRQNVWTPGGSNTLGDLAGPMLPRRQQYRFFMV